MSRHQLYLQSLTLFLVVCLSYSVSHVITRTFKQQTSVNQTKIVCYYSLPHQKYNGTLPPDLNATLCTHIIFFYSMIVDCQIQPKNLEDIYLFQNAIPVIRKQNPSLKVLLSSGGGGVHDFSETLLSAENRQRFIDSASPFLRNYGFDGLDLDWEFPGWNGKPIGQRKNFTLIVQGFRAAFEKEAAMTKKPRLLLSAAVSAVNAMMIIYEIKELGIALDMVNVMGYDYNSFNYLWPLTDYNSPLFPETFEVEFGTTGNLNWSAHAWVRNGIPKEKLMVGVPAYSHAYTLYDPKKWHGHWALAYKRGKCDSASYVCACNAIKHGAVRVFDNGTKVPYIYYGDQWVSYDDEESLALKAKFVMENGFGGIMVFSMNTDDYAGECDHGVSKFPLLSAIHNVIFRH